MHTYISICIMVTFYDSRHASCAVLLLCAKRFSDVLETYDTNIMSYSHDFSLSFTKLNVLLLPVYGKCQVSLGAECLACTSTGLVLL